MGSGVSHNRKYLLVISFFPLPDTSLLMMACCTSVLNAVGTGMALAILELLLTLQDGWYLSHFFSLLLVATLVTQLLCTN